VNLFGTPDEIHMHSGSIRIISNAHKIHFGALNKSFFQPSNSNLFSNSSSTLLSCCAVSRVIKGLKALSYDTSTGVTLASRRNSASKKLQGLVVLSLQDSPCCSTSKVLGDVTAKISPNACPRAHLQEPSSNDSQATPHFLLSRN
jgi:hypothetical protein